ncbi:tripartite tricarboxylate transporter substrate binding protein [Hydrogenophaga sp.]|uniref:Bug family tripartite tricarboxylate transporter substrate binding protein n=1 Tax=Hydrogenophaga sp. TaxID=1904254 RepID=UPI0027171A9C|nr:tripartite tricarboxylate transporter substrate binding protein [Hydrogenophaga sp.]MDO9438241.1 tripartite tricarboxylate transporter substrate binding protein [Hydrogenophaga sp.]
MNKLIRSLSRAFVVLSTTVTCLLPVHAQTFPSKPVRLVVPYLTGGLPDVMARLVAQKVSETTGQSVIVDNRSGASGIIAAEHVAKSAPDGYTVFVGDIGHYAINPAIYPTLAYNPGRDFAPITAAVHGPLLLVVNADVPVNTLQELIAYAKARPGKVNYGSPGNASVHQLAMAQLALSANVEMTHIPYRSLAQAVPALLTNDVSVMFSSPPAVSAHVKSGKLRVLAVAADKRTPLAPGVPTVAEEGFPGFTAVTTIGFLAPAATPPEVMAWLHREFTTALRSKDVSEKMPALGVSVVADAPSDFARQIRADQQYFQDLVKRVGLKID